MTATSGRPPCPGAAPGMRYKYRICGADGRRLDHCDPYGFFAELRPATASVLYPLPGPSGDCPACAPRDWAHSPLSIYELHAGSWKKPDAPGAFYTYRELAEQLVPYLLENRFQYLELMPLCEYPCDESWGYQGTGFFSPHGPLRHTGRPALSHRRLPPGRHRRAAGFRAGALCG